MELGWLQQQLLLSFFLSLELFPCEVVAFTHASTQEEENCFQCMFSVCLSHPLSLSVLLPFSTFTWIEFLASTTSLQAREQEEKEKLSLNLIQQLLINKDTSVSHYLYPSTPLTPLSFPSPNPTTYWSRRRSRISQKQKQNKHTHTHTQTHQQTRLIPKPRATKNQNFPTPVLFPAHPETHKPATNKQLHKRRRR
jgi:hypothetical protein